MLMTKSNKCFFQQSRELNSKNNDPVWPVFEPIRDFIHAHIICKFQEDPLKTEWIALITMSNRGFFSNQGDVNLRLVNRSGQCSNIRDFIHVYLICKFQEDPIKPECVILMTMSNRGFFSNQGNVTLRLIIRSRQSSY